MAEEKLSYKKIAHTIDAGFGVEQVYESPFILHDDTAKKFVSYVTQYNLLSNKYLRGTGDSSWRNIRKGDIVTITVPRFNITAVEYLVCEINTNFQGKYNFTLRPYDDDLYSDVVLTASTAWTPSSGYGSIYEVPFVTVSPTPGEGMFTTITAALAGLPNYVRRVILLRGTYAAPTNPYSIPTGQDLEIIGESKSEVILINNTDDDLFQLFDCTKKYRFSNFTIDAVATATGTSSMFYILGVTSDSSNTSDVTIDNVIIDLNDDNYGVRADNGLNGASLTIQNCKIHTGDSVGIYVNEYADVSISDNKLIGLSIGIKAYLSNDIHISMNKIREFTYAAIDADGGAGELNSRVSISDNICKTTVDACASGITASYLSDVSILNNKIKLEVDTNAQYIKGIKVDNSTNFEVSSNEIYIDNAGAVDYEQYGIRLGASTVGGIVSSNHIDLVNAYTDDPPLDIGILCGAGCSNCQGNDNVTYNVGVAAQGHTSNGNDISGSDEGTPF